MNFKIELFMATVSDWNPKPLLQRNSFLIWQSSSIGLWLILTYKIYSMSYNKVEKISSTKYCTKIIRKKVNVSHLSSSRQKLYNSLHKMYLSIFRRLILLTQYIYFCLSPSQCSQVFSFTNWASLEIRHSVSSWTKQWVININIYYLKNNMYSIWYTIWNYSVAESVTVF